MNRTFKYYYYYFIYFLTDNDFTHSIEPSSVQYEKVHIRSHSNHEVQSGKHSYVVEKHLQRKEMN